MEKVINGYNIATGIKDNLKNTVSKLNKKPCLAIIILGNDTASHIYIKNKIIACDYIGIKYKKFALPEDTKEEELLALIDSLNNDKDINAILVQLPLPKHINEENVFLKINPLKDVDGFTPFNKGLLLNSSPSFIPCTPLACLTLLEYKNIDLNYQNCLIIGRSNIVGRPLFPLLLSKNATVTIAHSKTNNLDTLTKNADVIFIAIGKPHFLTSDMIKKDAIIIDVGINRLQDGTIAGDCHFDSCYEKAKYITPVPKGVGAMTVAMLMQNCIKAYHLQNKKEN